MRRSDRWGAFRFGLRTRRFLSSGYAFARTWWVGGFALSEGGLATARAAADRAEAAVEDDDEKASRAQDAAQRGAAWLRSYREKRHTPRVGTQAAGEQCLAHQQNPDSGFCSLARMSLSGP